MTALHVFADESGTMPRKDDDKAFVAAAVAFLGDPPVSANASGHTNELVEELVALNAIPFLVILKPFEGYSQKIETKLLKMNLMARVTRLLTGANAQYLTVIGVALRNYVWTYAMQQAVGHAIVFATKREEINAVHVVLDQKTLPPPTRGLLIEQVKQKASQVENVLVRHERLGPATIQEWIGRIRFSADDVSVKWSDEDADSSGVPGLRLADQLARLAYRQSQRPGQGGICQALKAYGYANFKLDIERLITQPLDSRSVGTWERNTGLREPSNS